MEFSVAFLNGIFEVEVSGTATPDGYADLLNTLIAHEYWRPGSLVLSDETGLETANLMPEDVETIARAFVTKRAEIGASRFAVIAPADLVFGMNRMWEAYVDDKWDAETHVFKNRREAMEWLSV